MRRVRLAFAALLASAACSTFAAESPAPAPADGGVLLDASGPSADAAASTSCPADMVKRAHEAWTFCIDRREATRAQYRAFRDRVRGDDVARLLPSVPAGCTYASVLDDVSVGTSGGDEVPVTQVSFCSAALFCAFSGKRLCGSATNAGGAAPSDPTNARMNEHEWVVACTNGLTTKFPWGNDFDAGKCQIFDAGPRPVGADPSCATPDGIVDLIGNVWEWVHERTDDDAGGASYTRVVGGSYDSYDPVCRSPHGVDGPPGKFAGAQAQVGIRCCADVRR